MSSTSEFASAIAEFIAALQSCEKLPLAASPVDAAALEGLGFICEGDAVRLPESWHPLDAERLKAALSAQSRAWLTRLDVLLATGSTNAELAMRAGRESIAGHTCLAELQVAGRGRRGRTWQSPLGANLALSVGFSAMRPAAELGAFSLVVGLAVLDALESSGVDGLELKWPNDVWRHGRKLGGILIELVDGPGGASLIVGIGLNLNLPALVRDSLEQPVSDLADLQQRLPERSTLAARIISSLVNFELEFRGQGFAPFMAEFDRRHGLIGRAVSIIRGDQVTPGQALQVAPDGGLRVSTDQGEEVIHGGEVSLRLGGCADR